MLVAKSGQSEVDVFLNPSTKPLAKVAGCLNDMHSTVLCLKRTCDSKTLRRFAISVYEMSAG